MTANDPPALDDRLVDLLVAWDGALAGGTPPPAPGGTPLPGELGRRLERDLDCLKLLRGVLRRGAAPGAAADFAAESLPPPSPGERATRLGRFRLRRELGRGAHGIVYLAHDPSLGREVALKVPRPEALATPELRRRFLREAQAAAALEHPGLVPVFEAGEVGLVCFIASAYCPGPTLAEWLRRRTDPVPPRLAARWVAALAEAVQHAHDRGVVHRDLKPSNILLPPDGAAPGKGGDDPSGLLPRITDFGLARVPGGPDAGQTASGTVLGTPSYMAPEQAAGCTREVGPAADTYALGAVLYELLTGRPPFRSETPLDTLRQVTEDEPLAPRRLRPGCPRELETVCLKCLHKEPARRYASARELAGDLRAFLEGRPIRARPVGGGERAWRWCRRNPAVAGLLAAVALALLLGAGAASFFAVRAEARRQAAEAEKGRADDQANEARKWALQAGRRLYVSDLRLTQQRWEDTRVGQVLPLLEGQRPERTNGTDLRGFEWFYWWRLCHSERLALRGHTGPVSGVAYSPDGRRLASASWDRTVRVWDAGTGREVLCLKGNPLAVECVAFSPDGRLLAAALGERNKPGEVRLWDAATGRPVRTLKGHLGAVHGLAFSPRGRRLATASLDRTAKVWDTDTGREVLTLKGHAADVRGVAFSPGGRLATASEDRTVRVWDGATGRVVRTLRGHDGPVWSVAYSPDGSRLASASQDLTVRVWDAASGKQLLCLRGHVSYVWRAAFSPDGGRLASASDDTTVRVWDAATGRLVNLLKGHTSSVYGVSFGPDGGRLATASHDRTVKVWDAAARQEALTLGRHTGPVYGVAYGRGGRLASGSQDRTVRVWDAATGREIFHLEGHTGAVRAVAYRPDGGRLASASDDTTVRVWDAATGRAVRTLRGHTAPVLGVAYHPDGRRLASASEDGTVKVWDVTTGRAGRSLGGHAGPVCGVAYSPDGRLLAGAAHDGTVKVWDAATGREFRSLKGHTAAARGVAFSTDGRLASGSDDGTVKVWDPATGREVRSLKGHDAWVLGVCFSPDGRRLVSASEDRTIKVWDMATGQEVLSLKRHTGPVRGVAFSPDGRRLISGSMDHTVKVWPPTAGGPQARPRPRSGRAAARVGTTSQQGGQPGAALSAAAPGS